MCKKVAFFLILVLSLAAGITNAKPLNQDPGPDGIISVEAEHYDNKTVGDNGDEWVEVGPMGDFTGVAGMQAQPDNNTGSRDTNYAARSPRLDYEIDFVKTGTYYVWILAYGDDGNSDSCHSGLDGEEISTCDRMDGWNGNYEWNSQTMDEPRATFEVTSIGVHTFNIWMREDGLIVDKIVLTTNPNFTLSGSEPGPAAFSPTPSDGAEDVPRDLVLSWESGLSAGSHDVYFGTSFEDVDQATATDDPAGVYKGRIITNSYTLPERLDFDQRKAYVKKVDVDYFTQAIRYTQVKKLEVEEDCTVAGPAIKAHGDVQVRSQVVGFKKIKFFTLENVGSGKLELPENEMHTTAYWITLGRELIDSLSFSISEMQDGLFGLLYALESIASLLLMCDRMDLGTTIGEGDPSSPAYNGKSARLSDSSDIEFFEPTLFLFDAYPGGIGLSEPLYGLHEALVSRARQLITDCRCEKGCPSCVGPAGESSERAKEVALAILERMQGATVVSH